MRPFLSRRIHFILVWNPVLGRALKVSSMGIRVDAGAMHKQLLSGKLPLGIGDGIGQSRLCMLFLQKAHI